MRNRKLIHALFLILCMMICFSFSAAAAETEAETETETEIQEPAVVIKKISGKAYLCDKATEKVYTGLKGIQEVPKGSGNYYYFKSKTGVIYTKKWIKKSKQYYYAGKDGILKSGWQTIAKKIYYFNSKTLARVTGWKKINKKYYYFNENGVQVTGWYRSPKYSYYLDPLQNGVKTIGWKTINKKTYYFNTKGRLQTGKFKAVDGKYYYSNKSGVQKTGLITINNKYYYFDASASGAMKTGWITVDGKTYYMSTVSSRYGQAITGWMQKGGAYYYFNEKGVMQKGWLTLGNKKYYLDPSTGKMTTGKKTIDGKSYDFGKSGYITIDTTPTGTWSIKINQSTCVVTIYRGSTPVKALICSVGLGGATPTGTFTLPGTKHRWHELFGNVYGQYTTTITGNILFHSVYYYTCGNNRTLSVQQYNKLGYPASAGCVRLTVAGAKYIYDNCPAGTKVTIFYGSSADDPLGKPWAAQITQPWDPTDPNL